MSRRELREAVEGYVFASPWLLGFFIFTLGPFLAALYFSLTDYNVFTPARWVGLDNYYQLVREKLFSISLLNTAYYTLLSVPLSLAGSLLIATLLRRDFPAFVSSAPSSTSLLSRPASPPPCSGP